MNDWESASGMGLNIVKCTLVPLFAFLLDDLRERIGEAAPLAAQFVIAKIAKYLGTHLGPGAKKVSWKRCLAKYLKQAMILKAKRPPLIPLAKLYNSDIFSILMYQGQFWEPPGEALKMEKYVLMSILGFPFHSILPNPSNL